MRINQSRAGWSSTSRLWQKKIQAISVFTDEGEECTHDDEEEDKEEKSCWGVGAIFGTAWEAEESVQGPCSQGVRWSSGSLWGWSWLPGNLSNDACEGWGSRGKDGRITAMYRKSSLEERPTLWFVFFFFLDFLKLWNLSQMIKRIDCTCKIFQTEIIDQFWDSVWIQPP